MIEETAEKQNVYVFRLCVYSPIVETLKSQNRYRQKRALSEVYVLYDYCLRPRNAKVRTATDDFSLMQPCFEKIEVYYFSKPR